MTMWLIRALLWLVPGLTAGPAGAIAGFLLMLVSKEGEIVYSTIHDLVVEAEDDVKHPEFAGEGHGWDKFEWVFAQALSVLKTKNIEWANRNVSQLIEFVVSVVKA